MPMPHSFRRQPAIQIRLIASTQAGVEAAQARLTLTSGALHWFHPRQGRRGEWLIYGSLILDALASLAATDDHKRL
ncbi:MAG TPA: hypothetical protein VH599_01630 [Ktedonobacterales bacterium]|jgi:hypothetical protein